MRLAISRAVFDYLRARLPAMSRTEREAVQAGNTWWDGQLFSGKPDWQQLHDLPPAALSDEEQDFLDNEVDTLCAMLKHYEISRAEDFPHEVWQFIKQHKFGGITIPKDYGGLGFSHFAYSQIVMKLQSRCSSVAVSVMIPNSGSAKLVLLAGTETQKNYYLPRFASGKELPAFALSSATAGSDAGAMPDTGIVEYGEFEGDWLLGIRLNWQKRYISFSPIATVLAMTFKLFDPEHLLGDKENLGVTLALIPTHTAGVTHSQRHRILDAGLQNGANEGKDVFIPLDWIIGGTAQIGKGWQLLMQSLAVGRSISMPALSAGSAKFACRYTGAYSRVRKQFNQAIAEFEGVQAVLARMAGETYLIEAARCVTAAAVLQGHSSAVIAAMVKYHSSEKMRQVINDAMDIQGGSGICLGEKNYLAQLYQALPINITVEGANILTRSLMIFGQGAVRCHPYIQQEMRALSNSDAEAGLREFDSVFYRHLAHTLRNFWLAMTASPLRTGSHDGYYQNINHLSAGFALASDYALLVLGGELKQRERVSGYFADALSQLYLCSCALKHYENQGSHAEDLPLLHWACQHSLYLAQQGLAQAIQLLPNRFLRVVLQRVIFPLGLRLRDADECLIAPLARILSTENAARARLTQGVYVNDNPDDVSGRMEVALRAVLNAVDAETLLHNAQKRQQLSKTTDLNALLKEAITKTLLTGEQAEQVRLADTARALAISVDMFE